MKKILAFFILLMITSTVLSEANGATKLNIGGYYKNFFTTLDSPMPNQPIMGAVVNRLRLNLSYTPTDTVSFAFAYDFTPRVQDPSLFSDSLIPVATNPYKYRLADFDATIYPDKNEQLGSVSIYHNLDRASVQFSTNFADISLGRDAIAWGSARAINPTDVVAPYSYTQLDTEDRIGVDAIRVRIPIGIMGEFDTGYIFGNAFNFEKSAFFLRSQLNAVETDFSILLVEFRRNLLLGLDIARSIGGAGFWLETAYVLVEPPAGNINESDNYLRTSLGLDYSFWGKTYGFIEYHFNGAGAKSPENFRTNLTRPAYTHGAVYLMGIHYLVSGLTYQMTPLITCSSQMFFNITEPSTLVGPQFGYNIAEDIYLSAGGFIGIGKRPENNETPQFRSEFGGYSTVFFSSFRVYF